jgi:hypothetical protein
LRLKAILTGIRSLQYVAPREAEDPLARLAVTTPEDCDRTDEVEELNPEDLHVQTDVLDQTYREKVAIEPYEKD